VTQTPRDLHPDVLAQLGNRVQHALRAFTPDDAKALKATARTFPVSAYDLEEVLTVLGTGEAVVTVLSEDGAPTPVAWTRLPAPTSLMAPAPPEVLDAIVAASPLQATYGQAVDRDSAYERLAARAAAEAPEDAPATVPSPVDEDLARLPEATTVPGGGSVIDKALANPALRSAMVAAGTVIGREIARGVFGTRSRRRR